MIFQQLEDLRRYRMWGPFITDNQPADILTKPLRPTKHQQCLELLNMMNMESV